ncbi:hypothetical protein PLESTB_000779100 [Pleodorina starrii]|uniref:OB domain-containing protein n=1 Tax=Pleodorina starrii TaxID=330485 RepID=A0A9W6F293_9CHLO|nr:hypothetical protein PLESTM_000505800 [Pleodorina starrii]GLC53712.1 hypothetical protein PLESTB_000779100 [Pleodorina starrii]GLC72895.1 hypothetical protein PLESTF_001307000 [Pleodorina starrii]
MAYGGYDAGASQFGGGGFMPSPAPGADNQYGGGGGGQKGRNQHNSLRAFTIRHLLKETANSDGENFTADGRDISTVTIVGRVTSYQEGPTRILLQVHDGTASMEVCSWVDDVDSQAQRRVEWQVGKYVRVYGNLKTFEQRRSITAFAVKPVTDHNEVTYHFLQSIMQHLHLTKGAPPTGPSGGGAMPPVGGARTPGGGGPYGGAPAGGGYGGMPQGGGGYGAPAPGPAGGDLASDLKHVFNQPHALQAANGLTVDQALGELRAMGRNYTMQQIISSCEFLAAEGLLYSTVNDQTFKSTGSS